MSDDSSTPKSNKPTLLSFQEIVEAPEIKKEWIIENLIPRSGNTIVFVAPEVKSLILLCLLSFCASAGQNLSPYGRAISVETCLILMPSWFSRAQEKLKLLYEKKVNEVGREWANRKLCTITSDFGGKGSGYLNWFTTQNLLGDSIPDGCELILFQDVVPLLSKKDADQMDYRKFSSLITSLNQRGIATVIFVQRNKKLAESLVDELLSNAECCFMELTVDPGAPTEFGGGFNVLRQKMSEFDTVPSCFQFWYTAMDRKLELGWEIRDKAKSASSAKVVAMRERQRRVSDLFAKGMLQKEIALLLDIDPATVSRDLSKLQEQEQQDKPVSNESDAEED